jgi:hypothetical protein
MTCIKPVILRNIRACGTQGLTELMDMLAIPEVQFVAVCDPNKESQDYVEFSKGSVQRAIANGLGKPDWRAAAKGGPSGREVGREIMEELGT